MELPANTSPPTSTELEIMGNKQSLGEATNLGCPGLETSNPSRTAIANGPIKISGKTEIARGCQTSAIAKDSAATAPGGS
jgi:hypothetical protein